LRSIHQHLGEAYHRVRLGIGHPGHKDAVAAYVLHDFAKADQDWLDDLMRGISDGAAALAAGDSAKFLNAVSLRVAPARNSGTGAEVPTEAKPSAKPTATPLAPAAPPQAPASPFDRLRGLLRKGD
jgi:PTH1 family peptidyl-tRNA hydrolase